MNRQVLVGSLAVIFAVAISITIYYGIVYVGVRAFREAGVYNYTGDIFPLAIILWLVLFLIKNR